MIVSFPIALPFARVLDWLLGSREERDSAFMCVTSVCVCCVLCRVLCCVLCRVRYCALRVRCYAFAATKLPCPHCPTMLTNVAAILELFFVCARVSMHRYIEKEALGMSSDGMVSFYLATALSNQESARGH